MIFCANPLKQYTSYKTEIDSAINSVLNNGDYILGKEVKKFENEFSEFIGTKYGIGVGSGTEALHIALKACDIGTGDEVITVSHTAVATATAISLTGAKPVFVDIEPNYYSIDTEKISSAITSKTKAIIPVHLYGCPVDMESLIEIAKKNNLKVIEDCAQAHGALYKGRRVGSLGNLSCFSFYPTKNLGAIGDGGIILTDDSDLAKQCQLIREYGWEDRYVSSTDGWNSRLDEIQASILRVKLKYLDDDNQKRRDISKIYRETLKDSELLLPQERKDTTHVYHLFVIRAKERDKLKAYLETKDVYPNIHYPVPIHIQPQFKNFLKEYELSTTESICPEILSLPIYPELTSHEVEAVVHSILNFKN